MSTAGHEWTESERVGRWLEIRDRLPRGEEMARVLVEDVAARIQPKRVLDLGTGGGAMIAVLTEAFPDIEAVGLDLSPQLLEAATERFSGNQSVSFARHDLADPLPKDNGTFDLIVSSWVIHHLPDERKRSLTEEAFTLLNPGGAFCNMDLVTMASDALYEHAASVYAEVADDEEDPSDQPTSLEAQLEWMRGAGFTNVECYWKWLFTAVMVGERRTN